MADSQKQLVTTVAATATASIVTVLDRVPFTSFDSIEYIVNVKVGSPARVKVFKMLVRYDDTTVWTQVYAKAGDAITFKVDAFRNGSFCEFRMFNQELVDFKIKATRVMV